MNLWNEQVLISRDLTWLDKVCGDDLLMDELIKYVDISESESSGDDYADF